MSIVPRRRTRAVPVVATEQRAEATRLGRRVLQRILEGPHPWGEFEVWPSRYGSTSFCLVVYPPGAVRSERLRFRAMRAWPPLGMLLGLVAMAVASQSMPVVVALVIGGAVYGGGALALARLAGPGRRQIRTLRTSRSTDGSSALDWGPQQTMEDLAALLLAAEHEHRSGRIDAVEFELAWGEVWHRIGARRSRQDSRRREH